MTAKTLLIVTHSQTGTTRQLLEAVLRGVSAAEGEGLTVVVRDALAATPAEVLSAHGVLLGTPENFGYMSGGLKYFFDRIYQPCLEHTQGLPYGLFIRAGNDGRGALASIERIVTGLRWRAIAPPVLMVGEFAATQLLAGEELGQTMAMGLAAGIF
ncbi:MAG: flavodoxin family protein [Gammaproteobacteria bacterium]|nr:flavodoxin family protein [Gammaproteobacteria bacterium]